MRTEITLFSNPYHLRRQTWDIKYIASYIDIFLFLKKLQTSSVVHSRLQHLYIHQVITSLARSVFSWRFSRYSEYGAELVICFLITSLTTLKMSVSIPPFHGLAGLLCMCYITGRQAWLPSSNNVVVAHRKSRSLNSADLKFHDEECRADVTFKPFSVRWRAHACARIPLWYPYYLAAYSNNSWSVSCLSRISRV